MWERGGHFRAKEQMRMSGTSRAIKCVQRWMWKGVKIQILHTWPWCCGLRLGVIRVCHCGLACHSWPLRAILQNCGWLQIITFLIVPNTLPTIWKTNNSEDTNIQAARRVRNYRNRKRTFFWFRKKYCLRLPTNMIISILAILFLLIPPGRDYSPKQSIWSLNTKC